MKQSSEFAFDLLSQVIEASSDLLLWKSWIYELHLGDILDDVFLEGVFNKSHGDLLLWFLRLLKDLTAIFVIDNDALEHAYGLIQRAVVVVLWESILLQELVLNNRCNCKRGFLLLIKRILTDQLDDFNKIIFFLKNLLNGFFVSHEFWISLVIIFL